MVLSELHVGRAVRPLLLAASVLVVPGAAGARQEGTGGTTRRQEGRPVVGAVRATSPVRLDGVLDEPFWQSARPATDFVQSEPREGQPASERTEVRIAYDADNLYVGARLWDSEPDAVVVNDIRKDFRADDQDTFELILDTFRDLRNGYVFQINAAGGRGDQQSANEGREVNTSWDAVWDVRTQRTAGGWTAEIVIPFRALRFADRGEVVRVTAAASATSDAVFSAGETVRPAETQNGTVPDDGMVWGINFSRRIRRRNEINYWAPVPRSYNLNRVSLAGTITGLPHTAGGRDLRVKPYVAARTVRETGSTGFDRAGDAGVDAKFGVTQALTLDLTVNPDFAQVEVDEQQVNLTQFNQFFPEKREFFLENSGVFYVGDAARNNRLFQPPTPDEDLLLFFSRRIGLTPGGREIPILGGARLTGGAGGFIIGALTAQTRAAEGEPENNYSALRVRRNVFRSSDVGAVFMMRQSTDAGDDYNRVFGADFNLRLPGQTDWNSYVIRTQAPGAAPGQYAWRTSLNHEGNFFHGKAGFMAIGEGFVDDLGYYRRTAIHKWVLDTGLRPRLEALRRIGIREMHPHVVWDYYTDLGGNMVGKKLHSGYTFFLDNGAYVEFSANPRFEEIISPLRLHPDAPALPAGDYGWNEWTIRGTTDPSRAVAATFTGTTGGLWSGTQQALNTTVTVKPSYRFRTSLGLQRTHATMDAPVGEFTRTIWTARANYSFNTRMFVDAFTQYDPDRNQFNTNLRLNLMHHPLSDLFIVYNEQRITGDISAPPGRSLIIKVTQMVAF
jgi:hypothetical protein